MSEALVGLGYKPKYRHDGRYPSEKWERITSHGYDVQELIFDTIHGGPWTFECYAKRFVLDSECNWTTQERIEFNPASRDFISCTTGKWMREPVVLTADECMAISDHISMLERKRKLRGEGKGLMSEYIIELPDSGAADEFVAKMGVDDCRIYGYRLNGEIVRCGDCQSWFRGHCRKHVYTIVVDGTEYNEGSFPMDASDFCSLGTRKENHAG